MFKILDSLSGSKTYIIAVLIGLCYTLETLGYFDAEMRNTYVGLLGSMGLVSLRHGVEKSGPVQ